MNELHIRDVPETKLINLCTNSPVPTINALMSVRIRDPGSTASVAATVMRSRFQGIPVSPGTRSDCLNYCCFGAHPADLNGSTTSSANL